MSAHRISGTYGLRRMPCEILVYGGYYARENTSEVRFSDPWLLRDGVHLDSLSSHSRGSAHPSVVTYENQLTELINSGDIE